MRLSSEILVTRGHIHPATTSNIELEALMEDGTRVRGETKITASKVRIQELSLVPPNVEPLPQTLDAIARADIISDRSGLAIHQPHSQPAGAWHRGGHRRLAGNQGLHL